jgi:hypothetical protein
MVFPFPSQKHGFKTSGFGHKPFVFTANINNTKSVTLEEKIFFD